MLLWLLKVVLFCFENPRCFPLYWKKVNIKADVPYSRFSQYSPCIFFICWYFKLLLAWWMLHYQRKEKCLENTAIVLALDLQIGNLGSLSKGGGCFYKLETMLFFLWRMLHEKYPCEKPEGLPNLARVDLDVLLGWDPTVYYL